MAKGLCQIGHSTKPVPQIRVAVENGVVLAIAPTQLNANIFVNFDRWEQ
jgi:hypothetical protein